MLWIACFAYGRCTLYDSDQRNGQYKKRPYMYLRGFGHRPHGDVDAGQHGCKITDYKSTNSPLPPSIKCSVLRESLSEDSQNLPCAAQKRRGSWVISIHLGFWHTVIQVLMKAYCTCISPSALMANIRKGSFLHIFLNGFVLTRKYNKWT